jgi:predicted nuclease of predicted toxin-antitoxin system
MKILIDQNISFRIIPFIKTNFSLIDHVIPMGWINYSDHLIFKSSKNYDAILTQDDDFENILLKYGKPPKIIRIRAGNLNTVQLSVLLKQNITVVEKFINHPESDFLEIFKSVKN